MKKVNLPLLLIASFITGTLLASGAIHAELNDASPSWVTITCPSDVTVSCDPGLCSAYVNLPSATAAGSEPIDSIWNDYTGQASANATYPAGTTIITWYAVDILGELDSCTMTVTVQDNQPPIITCPPITIPCPEDYFPPDSSAIPAWDNCDANPLVTFVSESYEGLGVYPGWCPSAIHRIYRATDNSGNSSTCEQTITVADVCDCAICQDTVPHFYIDLSGDCESTFTIPDIGRDGFCCDASWPDRCISFSVMIGEGSVGVYIEITEGAVPGGWWWQVDCGDSVRWDETICIEPGVYHTITMCEAGNSENTYVIRAVCGMIVPDTVSIPVDCTREITVEGVEESTVTWNSIYPGASGQYNGNLSCTTGCLTTLFTPDTDTPQETWYLVCGSVVGNPCGDPNGTSVCDTVVVQIVSGVEINISPDPPVFCEFDPHTITAAVYPPAAGYSIKWWSGPDGTGSNMSTSFSYTPSAPGQYSVTVMDTSGVQPCGFDTLNFAVELRDCLQGTAQEHCMESEIVIYNTVTGFVEAGGDISNFPCLPVPPGNISLLARQSDNNTCPETIFDTYEIWDACDNHDTCKVIITLNDTIPPVLTCPPGLTAVCDISERPPYSTLAEFQAAGGSATDYCGLDPSTFEWVHNISDGLTCPETVTRLYRIADFCLNWDTCAQTITIDDNVPPTFTCPPDMTVDSMELVPEPFATLEEYLLAGGTASDNCGFIAGSFGLVGETIVTGDQTLVERTYSISDSCNNPGFCTMSIMVGGMNFGIDEKASDILPVRVFPNPLREETMFSFDLEGTSLIRISVTDRMGQTIARIFDGTLDKGRHQLTWNAKGIAPGIYFYRLTATSTAATGKRQAANGKLVVGR